MPYYTKDIGAHPVRALVAGIPTYLFGSWPLSKAPTRFLITQVSLTANVATITGAIIEGDVPVVPAANQPPLLVSVKQTQSNGGVFNVNGATVTAVAINASTGIGTLSFSLTNANIGAVADAGIAYIPYPETAENLVNGSSVPCTMPVQDPKTDSARTVDAVVSFPSLPTTATVVLQSAVFDQDPEFQSVGTVAVVSGGAVTQGPFALFTLNQARFYRLGVSGVTGGTNPSIVGKILV